MKLSFWQWALIPALPEVAVQTRARELPWDSGWDTLVASFYNDVIMPSNSDWHAAWLHRRLLFESLSYLSPHTVVQTSEIG